MVASKPSAIRDQAYYLRRLRDEHPLIYKRYLAGAFESANRAFIAAGLKKDKSTLTEAKQVYRRMTTKEQLEFVKWLRASVPRSAAVTPPIPKSSSASTTTASRRPMPARLRDGDGRLTHDAKKVLNDLIARKSLKPGELMVELGFKSTNMSLQTALTGNTRIQKDVEVRLLGWIAKNST